MTRRKWTDEEIDIVLALPVCVAAEKIGLHIQSIRRAKRRFLQKKENALFDNRTPVPKRANLLNPVKMLFQKPIQFQPILKKPTQPIPKTRNIPTTASQKKLCRRRLKPSLAFILSRFPFLNSGQIETASKIFQNDPASAYRYCRFCKKHRIKKANEPTHIRYNRRRKIS